MRSTGNEKDAAVSAAEDTRPLVYIAGAPESEDGIDAHIQAMGPALLANGIQYIVGPGRPPAGLRRPALYYCPHFGTASGANARYSILRVPSLHPSAPCFRCAERIKRYREPVLSRPVYISRAHRAEWYGLSGDDGGLNIPAVWDQLIGSGDGEPAVLFARRLAELARQTVRGICDFLGRSFRDMQ